MHLGEGRKTTNSARLVKLAIPETEIRLHGERDAPLDCSDITRDGRTYLLFPDPSGAEVTPEFLAGLPGPLHLVVPDGNWTQARRIARRVPQLARLPRIHIQASGADPLYRVRRAPREGSLCTLSAIARVLGIADGIAVQRGLEGLLQETIRRIEWCRQRTGVFQEEGKVVND